MKLFPRILLAFLLTQSLTNCKTQLQQKQCDGPDCGEPANSSDALNLASQELLETIRNIDPKELEKPSYLNKVIEKVSSLLDAGADPAYQDPALPGKNVFHELAEKGDATKIFNLIVSKKGSNGLIDANQSTGTPLSRAMDPVMRDAMILESLNDKIVLADLQRQVDRLAQASGRSLDKEYRNAIPLVHELSTRDPDKLAFLLGEGRRFVYRIPGSETWRSISTETQGLKTEEGDIDKMFKGNRESRPLWETPSLARSGTVAGEGRLVIVAHRGFGPTSQLSGGAGGDVPPGLAPENTRKAFLASFSQGADAFELDVYVAKDGTVVVIHDNELNRNVAGVDRRGTDLGVIEDMDTDRIKTFNVGQGQKIPTLMEIMDLAGGENKIRGMFGHPPLMINIELKGEGSAIPTAKEVLIAIDRGVIRSQDVVYTSFKHEEFGDLRKLHPEALITPGIKTSLTFGSENVDTSKGWYVAPDKKMTDAAIDELSAKHRKYNFVGLDAPLWDIDERMVELAKRYGLQIHASTSDFRDLGKNSAFMDFLLRISDEVPVFFKTDEPLVARKMMELRASELSKLKELNLGERPSIGRLIKPGTNDYIKKFMQDYENQMKSVDTGTRTKMESELMRYKTDLNKAAQEVQGLPTYRIRK